MGRIKIIQDLGVQGFGTQLALWFRKNSLRNRSLQVQFAGDLKESNFIF